MATSISDQLQEVVGDAVVGNAVLAAADVSAGELGGASLCNGAGAGKEVGAAAPITSGTTVTGEGELVFVDRAACFAKLSCGE